MAWSVQLRTDPALANSGNSIPVGFLEPEALSLKPFPPFPHYNVIMQQNPTQVATDNATTLAIGDFNGDGKLDLVGTSLYCYRQTRPLARGFECYGLLNDNYQNPRSQFQRRKAHRAR